MPSVRVFVQVDGERFESIEREGSDEDVEALRYLIERGYDANFFKIELTPITSVYFPRDVIRRAIVHLIVKP